MDSTAGLNRPQPAHTTGPVTDLQGFVIALFFFFGGITSLNDVLIPKLKGLFQLNYAEAMLVQFAFFLAYLVVSLPAGALVQRFGYMRTAAIGLLTMTAGCLLFIPASLSETFLVFLIALFVLASGVTIVQVVANPLISMLGSPKTVHSRLTFAQAFNALGTTVFPYVGAILILGSLGEGAAEITDPAARSEAIRVVDRTYAGIAAMLLVLAGLVWLRRGRLQEQPSTPAPFAKSLDLLKRPRFAFGTLGIFLYVGAEVSIGSILVNYLMQADTLHLPAESAGKHVAFYWGGAMVGRFIGAWVLRRFPAGVVLAVAASVVMALLLTSGLSSGAVSGYALIGIGLFNSIMFPTIFSLASEGLGSRAAEGSGLICMAIVGGAIVPLLTGFAADLSSLRVALAVPLVCYVGIAAYGRYCQRHRVAVAADEPAH